MNERAGHYRAGAVARLKRLPRWSVKTLSSMKTSVYILGAFALLYMVGTIFPQGGDINEYAKAGGKYVPLVRFFGLLNFFSSPVFLMAAFLFLLNLVVCTYKRYSPLFAKREFPGTFAPTHSFKLTHDYADAVAQTGRVLRERLGFRLVSKDAEWVVMEKGLSWRWLTWLYHAGIVVCFFGLLLSYLFAFEGELTLKPRTPVMVAPPVVGRLAGLFKKTAGPAGFSLYLDDFSTEYVERPTLDYPRDRASRLAIGLGWKAPEYSMKDDSMTPKGWRSRLRVMKGGRTVAEKTIEVNEPLRYGGYTFYQAGYEQTLKVRVDLDPIALDTKADEDLMVPGIDTPLRFGSVKTGRLYRLDGAIDRIVPFTNVKAVLKTPIDGKKTEDLGRIELGGSIVVDNRRVYLADFDESSILSYRYDPGFPVLWWGGAFVLIAMCLRFYGRSYMVAYAVDASDRIVCLNLHIASKGLLADAEKLAERVRYYMTRDDIKPIPLPPA